MQVEITLDSFTSIFDRAASRKGGEAAFTLLLDETVSEPLPDNRLLQISDADILSEMTKCVFRSGFVWKIIEAKWSGFEQAFHHFDVTRCAMLSDEELEKLQRNVEIVRHGQKIRSVPVNAQFVLAVRAGYGSFAQFLATWPPDDVVGLWTDLKVRGSRLGGQTGRYFLRFIGYDTPMLSADVVQALVAAGVVDKPPTGKRALQQTQAAFTQWKEESGWSYNRISRVLACSVP